MIRSSLRLLPALILLSLAVTALGGPQPAAAGGQKIAHASPPDGGRFVKQIRHYRRATWRWQSLMGVRHTRASRAAIHRASPKYRRWVRDLWRHRARRAHRLASNPPHRSGWLCIHRYEGAWNDPSGPYYGGLQMDLGFQRTYGGELLRRKGTANRWTPLEQMWVAERAHRSGRGYYPWPNTARYCGLI